MYEGDADTNATNEHNKLEGELMVFHISTVP